MIKKVPEKNRVRVGSRGGAENTRIQKSQHQKVSEGLKKEKKVVSSEKRPQSSFKSMGGSKSTSKSLGQGGGEAMFRI